MTPEETDLLRTTPLSLGTLEELLGGTLVNGKREELVSLEKVTNRSTEVERGGVYVALTGTQVDGHTFLNEVAARGAHLAVVEKEVEATIPLLKVNSTRQALSRLASLRTSEAPQSLFTVGITGTNGKTTTVNLASALLTTLGTPSVSIGTLGLRSPTLTIEGSLTTPDPLDLYTWCALAKKRGFQGIVMEASSHALDQSRVSEMEFNAAVFTNLTRDHLNYHGTEENYFGAKALLFELLATSKKREKYAIINIDDLYGVRLVENLDPSIHLIRYGASANADLCLRGMTRDARG